MPSDTITLLLDGALSDSERLALLMPLVQGQLRAAAERALAFERPGHTLQATALVHEAYIRLVGDREIPWGSRAHFYVAAAEAMRRVLLDHARGKARIKRGGGAGRRVPLSVVDLAAAPDAAEIVAIDDALARLEAAHPEAAMVVRLRFYAGMTVDGVAAALGRSPRHVDRTWAFARAWMFRCLRDTGGRGEPR